MLRPLIATTIQITASLLSTLVTGLCYSDEPVVDSHIINFPDTKDYKTLVIDAHTHSVFSDGDVWPTIRIEEALKDGLDAIAVTEHLEYQPHLADIPHADRNRSYEIAIDVARDSDLIVINGAEITRDKAAGHMNALFLSDANKLFNAPSPPEPYDARIYWEKANEWPAQQAVEAANQQGAFVFWNHPALPQFPNGVPSMTKFHRNNISKGWLHGIEVAGGAIYYEEAFQMALDYNLTLMGNSDIHGIIDWDYDLDKGGHRPVTLVFAKEKTNESIKQALFDGRTVVWVKNLLIGRPAQLNPLLSASLSMDSASYGENTLFREALTITLSNRSDVDFDLLNKSQFSFLGESDRVVVPAHQTVSFGVKTGKKRKRIEMKFDVLNALVAPKKPAVIKLKANIDE